MSKMESPFGLESMKYVKKEPAIERQRIWGEVLKIMQESKELKVRLGEGSQEFNQLITLFEDRITQVEGEVREKIGKEEEGEDAWESIDKMKRLVLGMRENLRSMEGLIDEFLRAVGVSESRIFRKKEMSPEEELKKAA